jgi:hypothetical protein
MGDYMTMERTINKESPRIIRQSLKNKIDDLPEPLPIAMWQIVSFEMQKDSSKLNDREMVLEKRRQAFEGLKPYFGTVHLDKPWKEELYEALDEKYNRAR